MPIDDVTLVEDLVTNSLLIVGGKYSRTETEVRNIFRLSGPIGDESRWEEIPQKIKVGRRQWPVAFFVPDYLTDCKNENY